MGFDPPLALLVPLQVLHGADLRRHPPRRHPLHGPRRAGAQAGTAQALYASVTGGIGMGGAMLLAGPLYADYGGRAYWAMAVLAAIGLAASLVL